MSVETGLLLVVLLFMVLSLLMQFRLHQTQAGGLEEVQRRHAETLRSLRELERFVDRKLDRLAEKAPTAHQVGAPGIESYWDRLQEIAGHGPPPVQADAPSVGEEEAQSRPEGGGEGEEAGAAGEAEDSTGLDPELVTEAAAEDLSSQAAPVTVRTVHPEQATASSRRLAELLGTPEFLGEVWPKLVGPFSESKVLLFDYLARQGVAPPQVLPHPPLPPEARNHWSFLIVDRFHPTGRRDRVLVPRCFSRYDPALHDHLFEIRGRGTTFENFLRECDAVTQLKPTGDLEGFIDRRLVERKGIVRV